MIDDVFEISWAQSNIEGMEHRTHGGNSLVELKVAIVIPHKARDAITFFDANVRKRMSQLVRSVPGGLQSLTMRALGKQRHDFFIGIELRAPTKNSG